MKIDEILTGFIEQRIEMGDLHPLDEVYITNRLLDLLEVEAFQKESGSSKTATRLEMLDALVEYAVETEVIDDLSATRDVFSAKIMDLVTPRPSEVNEQFWSDYEESPKKATDRFFEMSKRNNYIKTREIAQNIAFT